MITLLYQGLYWQDPCIVVVKPKMSLTDTVWSWDYDWLTRLPVPPK